MKRTVPFALSLVSVSLFLVACTPPWGNGGTSGGSSSSESSVTSSVMPTHNVSYVGTVEELGVSIYMQGTHKLTLDDGQFVLLESTDGNLSLNTYLGKRVEVRGSTEPTVEGDAVIMRVESVTVLDVVSSRSSESSEQPEFCGGIAGIQCKQSGYTCVDDPDDSCDPLKGGADCGGMCVPGTMDVSSAMSSVSSLPVSSAASSLASSKASTASVSSAPVKDADMEAQIVLMAKQNYADASLWTQKYCTSHIAFCLPVHKNWYFKSFGATTSNMWHVEFGMEPIDQLYQGVIVLNLVSGTSASAGVKDGQVQTVGGDIVLYKDWTDGNHFEITADARLRGPVEYLASHFTPYTPGE